MKKGETVFKAVEKGLWEYKHKQLNDIVIQEFKSRFLSWDGVEIREYLGADLPTARKRLAELKARNVTCKANGEPFYAKRDATKAAAKIAEAEAQREASRLTISDWIALYVNLPTTTAAKRAPSTIRNERTRLTHVARIVGAVHLDSLSSFDLTDYIEARSKEVIQRNGRMINGHFITPGAIRNEVGSLGFAFRIAKQLGEEMRSCRARGDDAVRKLREKTGLDTPTLSALMELARINPNPAFSKVLKEEVGPPARRTRTLSDAELERYFKAASGEGIPPFFSRAAKLACETALDLGSICTLTESQVDYTGNKIVVTRPKTGVTQHAPLTPEARRVIAEQLADNKKLKIRTVDRRVFARTYWDWEKEAWQYDGPLTRGSMTHWHDQTCKRAKIENFWFRDFRHCAITRWSRLPNVSAAMICEAAGWSISGGQFSTYINARAGGIADALK